MRFMARATALVNVARRAIWLKCWEGDTVSKMKLCPLSFSGELLLGKELESVRVRSADRKKGFPIPKKQQQKKESSSFSRDKWHQR